MNHRSQFFKQKLISHLCHSPIYVLIHIIIQGPPFPSSNKSSFLNLRTVNQMSKDLEKRFRSRLRHFLLNFIGKAQSQDYHERDWDMETICIFWKRIQGQVSTTLQFVYSTVLNTIYQFTPCFPYIKQSSGKITQNLVS